MASSKCKYVDANWFVDDMGEGRGEKLNSYPVKIFATRADWILNSEAGQVFLKALQKSDDLDLYNIIVIKTTIEYFYKKISTRS